MFSSPVFFFLIWSIVSSSCHVAKMDLVKIQSLFHVDHVHQGGVTGAHNGPRNDWKYFKSSRKELNF